MEYNGQHIETRQHVFSNKPPWPHILNTNALCAADSAGAGISRSRDPRTPAYPLLLLRCSGIVLNKTYYQWYALALNPQPRSRPALTLRCLGPIRPVISLTLRGPAATASKREKRKPVAKSEAMW